MNSWPLRSHFSIGIARTSTDVAHFQARGGTSSRVPTWIHAGRMKRRTSIWLHQCWIRCGCTTPVRYTGRSSDSSSVYVAVFFDARRPGDGRERSVDVDRVPVDLDARRFGFGPGDLRARIDRRQHRRKFHRELREQHVGRVVALDEIGLLAGLRQRHRQAIAVDTPASAAAVRRGCGRANPTPVRSSADTSCGRTPRRPAPARR